MRAHLYLNGNKKTKSGHISFAFIIMRGDFDAVQSWPFRYKVTVTLYDLNQNSRKNVTHNIDPDGSPSFHCPTSDLNIEWLIGQFCPLSELRDGRYQYVKEDKMYM